MFIYLTLITQKYSFLLNQYFELVLFAKDLFKLSENEILNHFG